MTVRESMVTPSTTTSAPSRRPSSEAARSAPSNRTVGILTRVGCLHSPFMIPPKVRLVVLFGGRSAEHDVSCVSASHVLRAVDPDRYEVIPVGITRDGRWITAEAAAALVEAHRQ